MTFRGETNPDEAPADPLSQVDAKPYCLHREAGPGARIHILGLTFDTSRGDLLVYDGHAAALHGSLVELGEPLWKIPRPMLNLHLPPGPRPLAALIPATGGLAALISAYLDALAGPAGDLAEPQATAVTDNLARLVAMACGGPAEPAGEALRAARLDQAKQHIQRHVSSPKLDPRTVAAGLGISTRQLHLLFEPTGESFSAYLRRVRLEGCRETLQNPLAAGRSVADIAFGWGFSSLPTFYRAFQAAYGMAPGDLRDAAGSR